MNFRLCNKNSAYYPQAKHNIIIDCQNVILKKSETYGYFNIRLLLLKAKFDLAKQ